MAAWGHTVNKVRIGQKKSPFRGGGRRRWIFGTAYAMIASSIIRGMMYGYLQMPGLQIQSFDFRNSMSKMRASCN